MDESGMHLIERAASRLRAESGLIDPPATPQTRDRLPEPPLVEVPNSQSTNAPIPETLAVPLGLQSNSTIDLVLEQETAAITVNASHGDLPTPVALPSGKILDISKLERGGLVVGRKSRTRISEEFRIAVGHVLRSLQTSYTAGHGSANLIMVTSSRPGEGKSFTSINLAGCIAQQNQREVLLVDIDAKQRPLTFELGLGDAPGLLDLVRDPSLRIEDVIVPSSISSLSFMPIGSRVASNAEMPSSRPISAVVERLGRRFANRVIILDAPPCLSTSDPSALAPIVGQILMVVEAERTQRNELVAALELVRVCPTITLLLNKIQLTTSYTFGAYHYFGTYS